jgi:pectate lyase
LWLAIVAGLAPGLSVAASPVAHWSFDDVSGSVVSDETGNGNYAELLNGATYAAGYIATGAGIYGSGSRIDVSPEDGLTNLDEFSITIWIFPNQRGRHYIFSKDGQNFQLSLGGTKPYLNGCIKVGSSVCSKSMAGSVALSEWQHVAMTYSDVYDRKVRLYINGQEVEYKSQGSARRNRVPSYDVDAPLVLGASSSNGRYVLEGRIDEARLFRQALDTDQILSLYQQDLDARGDDYTPLSVQIVEPLSDLVQTSDPTVELSGTTSASNDIVAIEWVTDQGESGLANGTSTWSAGPIPLGADMNLIEVLAYDAVGNMASDSVHVRYVPDGIPEFDGYGSGTTGGFGYPEFVAKSSADLTAILQTVSERGGRATIKLSGSWQHGSNVKLRGLADVTLDGTGSDVTFSDLSVMVTCSENVVLKGLRIRNKQTGEDSIQVNSSNRVVVAHNSVSGAGDGNIDVTGWSCGPSSDVTVSWNIFADTWKQSLVKYGETTRIGFHHNLFYNSGNRLPAIHGAGEFDVRNNVFWQWGSSGTALGLGARVNIVGNFYDAAGIPSRQHAAIWYTDATSKAWIADNVLPVGETDISRLDQPVPVPPIVTHGPSEARDLVLVHAGAWPRDEYDDAIVDNIENAVYPPPPPYHD